MTTLLERLRTRTRPHHDRIENHLDLHAAASSLAALRALLGRFYGFYQPVESKLQGLLSADLPGFFPPRRKAPLLNADLLALGMERAEVETLPYSDRLPALGGKDQALGVLYVLEGSTLGGQLIARHLERTLGLRDGRGYSFFLSYRGEVGTMWRAFGAALEAHATPGADEIIIGSACETFDRLGGWIREGGERHHVSDGGERGQRG